MSSTIIVLSLIVLLVSVYLIYSILGAEKL